MIYSSLLVLALSASAAVNPFTNLVHMHPRPAQPDTRVSVMLHNNATGFRDVRIGGNLYTVASHRTIEVKAPAGTVIYTASPMVKHHIGDAILEVTPELNNQKVELQ